MHPRSREHYPTTTLLPTLFGLWIDGKMVSVTCTCRPFMVNQWACATARSRTTASSTDISDFGASIGVDLPPKQRKRVSRESRRTSTLRGW